MSQKAATLERWPYADVTMFIKNWGYFAPEVAQLTSGVQQRTEKISADLVTAKDLMKCFRCNRGSNHLDSMCHTKNSKPYIRNRDREEDRGDFLYRGGPGDSKGGFRGGSRFGNK